MVSLIRIQLRSFSAKWKSLSKPVMHSNTLVYGLEFREGSLHMAGLIYMKLTEVSRDAYVSIWSYSALQQWMFYQIHWMWMIFGDKISECKCKRLFYKIWPDIFWFNAWNLNIFFPNLPSIYIRIVTPLRTKTWFASKYTCSNTYLTQYLK